MSGGSGPGGGGKAENAGPSAGNVDDPQGTLGGLDSAQEAQKAFNAQMQAEIAAKTYGGWNVPTNTINAFTGKPMTSFELAIENFKTQQAIENAPQFKEIKPGVFDFGNYSYDGPAMPNPMDNNPGYNYQDPAFDPNLSGFPHTGSGITIGGFTAIPGYNPGVEMIDPVNTTPVNSGATNSILDTFGIENGQPTNQQETDALMDAILGQQSMDNDVMGLDNAMVSTENNPWGYNRSVTASLNQSPSFDMGAVSQAGGGADLQRLIARQAAKKIINVSNDIGLTPEDIQDILPSTPPSGGGTLPSGGGSNTNTEPGTRPKRVETAAERLVKVITAPKISRSISRPILREAIKTGNITGSDNQVDLIRAILNPPKTLTRAQQINQSGRGGGGK